MHYHCQLGALSECVSCQQRVHQGRQHDVSICIAAVDEGKQEAVDFSGRSRHAGQAHPPVPECKLGQVAGG